MSRAGLLRGFFGVHAYIVISPICDPLVFLHIPRSVSLICEQLSATDWAKHEIDSVQYNFSRVNDQLHQIYHLFSSTKRRGARARKADVACERGGILIATRRADFAVSLPKAMGECA